MQRQPTTQDITWLLDLNRNGQLVLDPPYQRRSVWTPKDRRFFLDTIFRNFPSPAIFLHKQIFDDGSVKYNVVDGKQRLQTILMFVGNKISLAQDYGDLRLNGKRWKDLDSEIELKHIFWNYRVPVEMIDVPNDELINTVFDRLNRNSRKLTPQELRHAKFDGWLITKAEFEADAEYWKDLGIATRARSKRMTDVQFISELLCVVLEESPLGFGQEELDDFYAKYDDLADLENFSEQEFIERFEAAKAFIADMESHNGCVRRWAKGFGHFYTLWCVVSLNADLGDPQSVAEKYTKFMGQVEELSRLDAGAPTPEGDGYLSAAKYFDNARGASTEGPQRQERFDVLTEVLSLK
nr:DUF262 domain-containing protein [uncultured Shinella sp.]